MPVERHRKIISLATNIWFMLEINANVVQLLFFVGGKFKAPVRSVEDLLGRRFGQDGFLQHTSFLLVQSNREIKDQKNVTAP